MGAMGAFLYVALIVVFTIAVLVGGAFAIQKYLSAGTAYLIYAILIVIAIIGTAIRVVATVFL